MLMGLSLNTVQEKAPVESLPSPTSPPRNPEPERPKPKAPETPKRLSSFFSDKQTPLVFNTSMKVTPADIELENGEPKVKILPMTEENVRRLDEYNLANAEDIDLYRWKRCMTLDHMPENQDELNALYHRKFDRDSAARSRSQSDFNMAETNRRASTFANQSIANLTDLNNQSSANLLGWKTQPNLPAIQDPEIDEAEDKPENHIHS
eukprot:TRINITY_DN4418_c0_g2_i4.p1 TRINITY_DN4418_c0_g2~~TRINITY_DN4418_c0_g2_i4.p1  ORF type:complete len:207 (+),score=51.47 TRINITY_DN4418_c0_g2_i4:245-865(+)